MLSVYAHMTPIHAEKGNLGDRMGFLIADRMLGKSAYRRLGMRQKDDIDPATVGIVGSLVAAMCETSGSVVGGGLINGAARSYSTAVDFRGVRGFLTQSVIARDSGKHAPVIGDPGLLLSRMIPLPLRRRKPLGFIIHDVDRDEFRASYPHMEDCLVDNYAPEAEFVDQLSGYEAIASTSLHGCVFSHAYGIPVKPFVLTDKVFGGDFKFRDYYSSYGIDLGRDDLPASVEQIRAAVLACPQPTRDQVACLQDKQRIAILDALAAANRRATSAKPVRATSGGGRSAT